MCAYRQLHLNRRVRPTTWTYCSEKVKNNIFGQFTTKPYLRLRLSHTIVWPHTSDVHAPGTLVEFFRNRRRFTLTYFRLENDCFRTLYTRTCPLLRWMTFIIRFDRKPVTGQFLRYTFHPNVIETNVSDDTKCHLNFNYLLRKKFYTYIL